MAKHENFYENLTEAQMRLKNTVVLYDGEPVHIYAITDHKGDGAFRAYFTPVHELNNAPQGNPAYNYTHNNPTLGPNMDSWMDQPGVKSAQNYHIYRKKLNSPLFNKFRPFSLGMLNDPRRAYYLERQPQRPKVEQGLLSSALYITEVSASPGKMPRGALDIYTKEFRDCVLGDYPTPKTVLAGLQDPKIANESVAFDRKFALIRGPIDILFLGYKAEVIGVLPNGDFSKVRLGKDFKHYREVVDELNLFYDIV